LKLFTFKKRFEPASTGIVLAQSWHSRIFPFVFNGLRAAPGRTSAFPAQPRQQRDTVDEAETNSFAQASVNRE